MVGRDEKRGRIAETIPFFHKQLRIDVAVWADQGESVYRFIQLLDNGVVV